VLQEPYNSFDDARQHQNKTCTGLNFEVPGQSSVGLIGGRRGQCLGGTMASADYEPIIGVWRQSPQPGAEPLGKAP